MQRFPKEREGTRVGKRVLWREEARFPGSSLIMRVPFSYYLGYIRGPKKGKVAERVITAGEPYSHEPQTHDRPVTPT